MDAEKSVRLKKDMNERTRVVNAFLCLGGGGGRSAFRLVEQRKACSH